MRLSTLLLAPVVACQLLVPEMTQKEEEELMSILPVSPISGDVTDLSAQAFSQSVSIPCTECRGTDAMIRLDFSVQLNKKLVCNDIELYPSITSLQNSFVAVVEMAHGKTRDRPLGYSLTRTSKGVDEQMMLEVVRLDLGIIQVGRRFVKSVPDVHIDLVRAVNGDIFIGNIATSEKKPEAECDGWVCGLQFLDDWKESAEDKWSHLKGKFGKGCGGHHGSKPNRVGRPKQESGKHEDKHQGHHGHHGHHSHHDHAKTEQKYSWNSFVEDVSVHILLPMLMGAAAGAFIAIIGLLISNFVRLIVSLFRRRSTSYKPVPSTLAEEGEIEEKARLMEEQPAYEETNKQ